MELSTELTAAATLASPAIVGEFMTVIATADAHDMTASDVICVMSDKRFLIVTDREMMASLVTS